MPLITLRKAATISGILLCIAILEYSVFVHLYINLKGKQLVRSNSLLGITEAEVTLLEDRRTKLQKAVNQDSEIENHQKMIDKLIKHHQKMIAKLQKHRPNISNTKPLKTEFIQPNTGAKAMNADKRDRNALREPLRHPLKFDADDVNYRENKDHVTPLALEDSSKADSRQPRDLSRLPQGLRNTTDVFTKHNDTGNMTAQLPSQRRETQPRQSPMANKQQCNDSNLNRDSENSTRKECTTIPVLNIPEILVENDNRVYRTLTKFEEDGNNIMFTLRTTESYHESRLPLLFDTWMSETNCSKIFLVTDSYDWVTQAKERIKGELLMEHSLAAAC